MQHKEKRKLQKEINLFFAIQHELDVLYLEEEREHYAKGVREELIDYKNKMLPKVLRNIGNLDKGVIRR